MDEKKILQDIKRLMYRPETPLEKAKAQVSKLSSLVEGKVVGVFSMKDDCPELMFSSENESSEELIKKIALKGACSEEIYDFHLYEILDQEIDGSSVTITYFGKIPVAQKLTFPNARSRYFVLIDSEPIGLKEIEYLAYLKKFKEQTFEATALIAKTKFIISIAFQVELAEKIQTLISLEREKIEQSLGKKISPESKPEFEISLTRILYDIYEKKGLPELEKMHDKDFHIYSHKRGEWFFYEIDKLLGKIKFISLDPDGNSTTRIKKYNHKKTEAKSIRTVSKIN